MVENWIICCTNTKQNINIFFMIFEYMKVCVLYYVNYSLFLTKSIQQENIIGVQD
jgi:hypothetical protein